MIKLLPTAADLIATMFSRKKKKETMESLEFDKTIELIRKGAMPSSEIYNEEGVKLFKEFLKELGLLYKWSKLVQNEAELDKHGFRSSSFCVQLNELVTCFFNFSRNPEVDWSTVNVEWQKRVTAKRKEIFKKKLNKD